MTKDDIIDSKLFYNKGFKFTDGEREIIYDVMDDWSNKENKELKEIVIQLQKDFVLKLKENALFFQGYLSRFKKEDYARTQRMYKEAGGIFSHYGTSLEEIYNDFLELKPIPSESMEGVVYYFNNGIETNNIDEIIKKREQSKQ